MEYLLILESVSNALMKVSEFLIKLYQAAKHNDLSTSDIAVIFLVLIIFCGTGIWKMYSGKKKINREATEAKTGQEQNINEVYNQQKNDLEELVKCYFEENLTLQQKILKVADKYNILNNSVNDLSEMLKIKDKKVTETLLRMRVALRRASFEKRKKVIIEEPYIKVLEWDGVCQFIEEQIKPADRKQRTVLYTYIEEKNINGLVLLKEREKDFIKHFKLNKGQEETFKTLMKQIKAEKPEKVILKVTRSLPTLV